MKGKGAFLILFIGIFLLPFSPILSFVAMAFIALILSRPACQIPIVISRGKAEKLNAKRESGNRKELAYSTSPVFFCRTCGAVYTSEFLSEFEIPQQSSCHFTSSRLPKGTVQECDKECFYCGHQVEIAEEKQGYFERQANADDIKTVGSINFIKPLRFRAYVMKQYGIRPSNEELEKAYRQCVVKQIFLHFVVWAELSKRMNPLNPQISKQCEDIRTLMSITGDLNDISKKYDLIGEGKEKSYDIFYPDLNPSAVHGLDEN